MKRGRHDSLFEKIHRYRGLILVLSIPLLLLLFLLFLMPRVPSNFDHILPPTDRPLPTKHFVVIFDAGSSGSRVHVFCFDHRLDLLPIANNLELFRQTTPGLSFYADDPSEAANSLNSLLVDAENAIPASLHISTPVKVGATAGLRTLEGDASDRILSAVRDFIHKKSSFKFESDWVVLLDGTQEGAYQWMTINYLLGNLGKGYSGTVGVVDLGGGSVQMAYAISEDDAAKAPAATNGEDSYVKELFLKGSKYFLYVHSYLHYGLLAARAEILKAGDVSGNPCVMKGYQGIYDYGGSQYPASASHSGSSVSTCKSIALKALKVNDSACTHMKCTFGGIWNGGGGDGQKNLFVASFFFDRASEAGFVDPTQPVVKVKPSDFEDAAKRACELNLDEASKTYPRVKEENLPYLCMDLVYQYTLLVDGFALDPWQEITLVKKVKYGDHYVEAAWPLGSAIEAVSSL